MSTGRHRAPPRPPGRSPVMIGAATVAVVAAGGIGAPLAVATAGAVRSAPQTGPSPAVQSPAGPALAAEPAERAAEDRAGDDRASRTRAREILAERQAQIAAAAQKAAERAAKAAAKRAAERVRALHRRCGYVPAIQRQPTLDPAQMRNVRAIIDVAREMDLPPRAAVIALATAHQESWLKNLNWGDRDSAGLFQQRPSMGWGTRAQVTDPAYAARAFYRALIAVPGWERLPVTVAAQEVQRSAYGSRYARWELMAAKLVAKRLDLEVADLHCARR